MIEKCYQILESLITPQKVTHDLFDYLKWTQTIPVGASSLIREQDNSYVVAAFVLHSSDEEKEVLIEQDDSITILFFELIKDYFGIKPISVKVEIAIGSFTPPNANGFYSIEKCKAILYYNKDLSVVDVDFYYSSRFP